MNLFSRLRSHGEARHSNKGNNKSVLIGSKQGLFDDIVGFEDVKSLFEMAIKAETSTFAAVWTSVIWEIIVHELTY